jgi:hypothetical protein
MLDVFNGRPRWGLLHDMDSVKLAKLYSEIHMVFNATFNNISFSATSVVIGTDCIGCYKSNYHTITATTAPTYNRKPPSVTIMK